MNANVINALKVFPSELKIPLERAVSLSPEIREIRVIAQRSLFFYTSSGIRFVTKDGGVSLLPSENIVIPSYGQLENIVDRATGFSGFSHEKELQQGFVTFGDAFRLGICTQGSTSSFGYGKITSVAVRIPFSGKENYSFQLDNAIRSIKRGLLVAGAPASGKTTMLRYIARQLSDGIRGELQKVTVIDERNELSQGCYLGYCTDVLAGKDKAEAIMHAVRTLSPEYIICDEIGSSEETRALLDGLNSGVSFVCSMHAEDMGSLLRKKQFRILYSEGIFDRIVLLSPCYPGKIEKIYEQGDADIEIYGNSDIVSFP